MTTPHSYVNNTKKNKKASTEINVEKQTVDKKQTIDETQTAEPNSKANISKSKKRKKKKKNPGSDATDSKNVKKRKIEMSDERLKAYGLNPKTFKYTEQAKVVHQYHRKLKT